MESRADLSSSVIYENEELEDEPIDPRIQVELETLNNAAESINKLENELQKARAKFRLLKSESSQRLGSIYKKIGRKWVIKARPYYDLLKQCQKAQLEAQKTAAKFQKANSIYKAAKETVTLAEQQLMTEGGEKLAFDSAWQEMLNHATMRFMEAEREKRLTELEHQKKAEEYNSIQLRLGLMQKEMSRTISKSKQFYEMKDKLESRLQAERQNAEDVHLALICSKQKYKMALASLEDISEDVHLTRQRRRRHLELPERTPGVGAESDTLSEVSELPSITLDFMSETASQASFEDFSDIDIDITEWDDEPNSPAKEFPGHTDDSLPFWSRFGNNISRVAQDFTKRPSLSSEDDASIYVKSASVSCLNDFAGQTEKAGRLPLVASAAEVKTYHSEDYGKTSQSSNHRRDDLVDGAETTDISENYITKPDNETSIESKLSNVKLISSPSAKKVERLRSYHNIVASDQHVISGKPPRPSSHSPASRSGGTTTASTPNLGAPEKPPRHSALYMQPVYVLSNTEPKLKLAPEKPPRLGQVTPFDDPLSKNNVLPLDLDAKAACLPASSSGLFTVSAAACLPASYSDVSTISPAASLPDNMNNEPSRPMTSNIPLQLATNDDEIFV